VAIWRVEDTQVVQVSMSPCLYADERTLERTQHAHDESERYFGGPGRGELTRI